MLPPSGLLWSLLLLGSVLVVAVTLFPVRSSSRWCRVPPSLVSCFFRAALEGRRDADSGSKMVRVLVSLSMVLSERNLGDLGSFSREPSEWERRRPEGRGWVLAC